MPEHNSTQESIQLQFREGQKKFRYYIIALCVAAIGFSITETSEEPVKLAQIPLAIAIISWSLSIFFGLKSAKLALSALFKNNLYFDVEAGRDSVAGTVEWKQEVAKKAIIKNINKMSNESMSLSTFQERAFYLGVISFLIWHVLRMMGNTV